MKKKVNILNIDNDSICVLNKGGIYLIEELWILTRKELKMMKLSDFQIKQISIKLQLIGMDLNRRMYN